MRWSIRLGTFRGIPVRMHATFLLLLAWVGAVHWFRVGTVGAVAGGVAFILLIFACVLLHEFGHALAAERFGIRTRDVTLLPIGGLARLERMPEEPRQELWVALAGPAVNVAIAAVLVGWIVLVGQAVPVGGLSVTAGPVAERLLAVNVILVVFNLVPAFPMDGGRVLRALLATRLDYARATQIAATLGQGSALVFGFLGLFADPLLLFIALFVWIGAAQEASMVRTRTALRGVPVARVMLSDFRTLPATASVQEALELTLTGSQKDFPVVDGDRVVGVLRQRDLLAGLSREDRALRVSEVMQREFETLEPGDLLEAVVPRLTERECHTAPVTEGGRLVGIFTMDNLGEFMAIRSALEERDRGVPAAAGLRPR